MVLGNNSMLSVRYQQQHRFLESMKAKEEIYVNYQGYLLFYFLSFNFDLHIVNSLYNKVPKVLMALTCT